jgi:hypothetical protein
MRHEAMESHQLNQQVMRNRSRNELQEDGRSAGLQKSLPMKSRQRDGLFVKRNMFQLMRSILWCAAIFMVHSRLHPIVVNLNFSSISCNSTVTKEDLSNESTHDVSLYPHDNLPIPILTNEKRPAIPNHEFTVPSKQQVVCVDGELYGRTFNQIMQLTAARAVASDIQRQLQEVKVAVGIVAPEFNSFYEELFDLEDNAFEDTPRILLHYDGACDYTYSPRKLLYTFIRLNQRTVLQHLRFPKAIFREEAEMILSSLRVEKTQPQIITVHRRNLEGACIPQAQTKSRLVCPNHYHDLSESELVNLCNMEYKMVIEAIEKTSATDNDYKVVLMTDHQVPSLDDTFPIVSNYTFPVEMWIMTLSDQHYGNPMSTVDLLVYYWRNQLNKGLSNEVQQFPKACYKPAPGSNAKPKRLVASANLIVPMGNDNGIASNANQNSLPLQVVCIADDAIDAITNSQFIFHYVLQLAVALVRVHDMIGEKDSKLGLGPNFSQLYEAWFDNTPGDVLPYHFDVTTRLNKWGNQPHNCDEIYQPWDLFHSYFEGYSQDALPFLTSHLLPKAIYRQEAQLEIGRFQNDLGGESLVTVHRDTIDNKCIEQAQQLKHILCPNYGVLSALESQDFLDICNTKYSSVWEHLDQLSFRGKENPTILLFTDSKDPTLDEAFPHRILFRYPEKDFPSSMAKTQSLPVSVWMMILSDSHFGNPMSIFDLVLYHWRKSTSAVAGEGFDSSNLDSLSQKGRDNAGSSLNRPMMPRQCYSEG